MTRRARGRALPQRRQHGAVAIEFAFLFAIFFVVLYAAISYAMVMMVQQALTQAAAEGARAGIGKVDPLRFTTDALRKAEQSRLARIATESALSWLPATIKGRIIASGIDTKWTDKFVPIQTGAGSVTINMSTITVSVTYADYAKSPLMPILNMPGFGPVPNVPQNLVGRATGTP